MSKNDIICSIDTETTGRNPMECDIFQIAIVPMDERLEPWPSDKWFIENVKPRRFDNHSEMAFKVHGVSSDTMRSFQSIITFRDKLLRWHENVLGGARIAPLAHHWLFDFRFLENLFGFDMVDNLFSREIRDTKRLANMINDMRLLYGHSPLYPKTSLDLMRDQHGIANNEHHDAAIDAVDTAKLYKTMLMDLFKLTSTKVDVHHDDR